MFDKLADKRKRIERNRLYVKAAKDHPCSDCGIKYPAPAMEFDHLRDKVMKISQMVLDANSIDRIQIEIDKCELVCSNCHAIRTHNRAQTATKNSEHNATHN